MRKTPFFNRFIEVQRPEAQPQPLPASGLKAGRSGRTIETLKYPSDSDEGHWPI